MEKIDYDVLEAFDRYKINGEIFYNPFTEKSIYKNHKNWVLWISRTIGKNKTNQFLYLFESPQYSKISGVRLGLESFRYNRQKKWKSCTNNELKNGGGMKLAREAIQTLRHSARSMDLAECERELFRFINIDSFHIPENGKNYTRMKYWKDKMRIYYDKETIRKLCYLTEPPTFSRYSGNRLGLADYHYIRGFSNGLTQEETDNYKWAKLREYTHSPITRQKISKRLEDHYSSDIGRETRQRKSESMVKFNNTDYGKKLKIIQREKQSITMKRMIMDGHYTPNITNSWTNWEAFIDIDGKIKRFRSSWEACFWFCNQNLEYENVRIPRDSGCYISDFFDESAKVMYEIKPKNRYNIEIDKMNALSSYCEANDLNFKWINEDNILEYLDIDKILENESSKSQFKKLQKGLK